MAGVISEKNTSRGFTIGPAAKRELAFTVVGTDDEEEVYDLVTGYAPAAYLGRSLDSIDCEPLGGGVWDCFAHYVRLVDDSEYTFDTGGGTVHLTQSLGTVNRYAPAGMTAPDFQGAIGVTEDAVEGVDVPTPQYSWTETHRISDVTMLAGYKVTVYNLTGRRNNAPFKGFAAGECRFDGCSGSRRADEMWTLTYHFSCKPNVTGAVIGPITGIDKLGWEYLWVRYVDYADTTAYALVKRPAAAYVEKVLEAGDFSLLGIGTT